ncbi:MAG: Nuclear control of ATPase protein 2 [Watsoniomyces obsoletus]|nr:MAG: Nuclear control of ATPase protein 2 [Watsoniomyces obsoletus]
MSFVVDQVRHVDGQLDRLQLLLASTPSSPTRGGSIEDISDDDIVQRRTLPTRKLQNLVKALSTTSSPKILLDSFQIGLLLAQFDELLSHERNTHEELEWLLVGKAAVQTYGVILKTLLEQTIPLSEDIWYWNEVLGSYQYTALYSIQTSPLRLWNWSVTIYHECQHRLEALRHDGINTARPNVDLSWTRFYNLVRDSIRARSISLPATVLSPFALSRTEAQSKQNGLRKLRELSASGLGVLMNECLRFDVDEEGNILMKNGSKEEWKSIVEKSITLMETVLKTVTSLEIGLSEFEDTVFASVEDEPAIVSSVSEGSRQALLSKRLQHILHVHLREHQTASYRLARKYGRPSVIVRYWLPVTLSLAFSGTILGIISRKRAALGTWMVEAAETSFDFWTNWVVEPVRRIIGTIRHDEDSEVALMSKKSLEGDRASLERMVVDFVIDQSPLPEAEVMTLRQKVREGDLTPVLRVYERDLRRPFMGTIRGDLIRALLIQIQKTKVDVEVAIGGIDSLLKSQELVFGFIGLTPGLLVCVGVIRWLRGLFNNRKGLNRGKRQGRMIRLLRNLDRILASSSSADNDVLSYKDHGLLLCQVHELRQHAKRTLPNDVYREFLEEIHDLEDIRMGVGKQSKVVERIRWAYARWI